MKSKVIKCLVGACVIILAGCFQKPLAVKQWNDSMSSADDTCFNLFKFEKKDAKDYNKTKLWSSWWAPTTDNGLCSTKVEKEVKMYKYPLESDKRMREVLSAAALKCYWYVAIQGPGQLTLTYWGNDSKQLIYDVDYTKEGYTLTYEDSASMHYDEKTGQIHAIYDLWFHGGETYGLYGLKPTLESLVRYEYQRENQRKIALFGEVPKKDPNKKKNDALSSRVLDSNKAIGGRGGVGGAK